MRLLLRLFAECHDEADARELMALICRSIPGVMPTPAESPARYWKMPELFEFCIECGRADPGAFEALRNLQPLGWVDGGDDDDRSSVWNRAEEWRFLDDAVVWAELQLSAQAP